MPAIFNILPVIAPPTVTVVNAAVLVPKLMAVGVDTVSVAPPIVVVPSAPLTVELMLIFDVLPLTPAVPMLIALVFPLSVAPVAKL